MSAARVHVQFDRHAGGAAGAQEVEAVLDRYVGIVGRVKVDAGRGVGRHVALRRDVLADGGRRAWIEPIVERAVPVGSDRGDHRIHEHKSFGPGGNGGRMVVVGILVQPGPRRDESGEVAARAATEEHGVEKGQGAKGTGPENGRKRPYCAA